MPPSDFWAGFAACYCLAAAICAVMFLTDDEWDYASSADRLGMIISAVLWPFVGVFVSAANFMGPRK